MNLLQTSSISDSTSWINRDSMNYSRLLNDSALSSMATMSGKTHGHSYHFNYKLFKRVVAYLHLSFILFGTIGNIIAFGILMRPRIRKYSGMRYLAAICLADITCLYTWNFRIVYRELTGKNVEDYGPLVCRFTALVNYASLQASSWLICCIGMDRILTIVTRKKNAFTRLLKNTTFVIALVVVSITGLNLAVFIKNAVVSRSQGHLLIVGNSTHGHHLNLTLYPSHHQHHLNSTPHITYSCYKPSSFFQLWDVLHSLMYAFIPFTIILTENLTLT